MYLTINLIDATNSKQMLLAVCNLNIDTDEPEEIKKSYCEIIPMVHDDNFVGSAAEMLMQVTKLVLRQHPSAVLCSVNDNPMLADTNNTINVYMQKKGTAYVESNKKMAN